MKNEIGIQGLLLMYVGNLAPYQGVNLLLESFALALNQTDADLAIIGGQNSDIAIYRTQAAYLGIGAHVHFLGPKPLDLLANFLSEADILVSPRISGNNTPMKIYSYLHSGKPVLATNLPTHTQILSKEVAILADPTPACFCEAMLRLMADYDLRQSLGQAGKRFVDERFTFSIFREKLNGFLDWLEADMGPKTSLSLAERQRKIVS
jgi:glycosyltransferase involved in cell wall biosynthesis